MFHVLYQSYKRLHIFNFCLIFIFKIQKSNKLIDHIIRKTQKATFSLVFYILHISIADSKQCCALKRVLLSSDYSPFHLRPKLARKSLLLWRTMQS